MGDRISAVADQLPLTAGGFIGALALLIPYVLVTVVTYAASDRGDPLDVAATMFFTLVQFGPGQVIVDGFVSVTQISTIWNVRPADYPSIQERLATALDVLQTTPEAAFLALYVAFPWIVYLGGRYLSRHYATGDTIFEYLRAGATVVAGTLPVVLVLGIAFSPANLLGAVVVVGLVLPAVLGGLGALSVYAFRTISGATSKAVGWLGVLAGLLVAVLLVPTAPDVELELGQRLVFGGLGLLAAISFEAAADVALLFVVVVLATIGAGFLRAYLARDHIESEVAGIRLGASITLGYVGAIALIGVAVPLAAIVFAVGAGAGFAAALPDVSTFLQYVLVGGVIFPLFFGGIGGWLAVRHLDRQARKYRQVDRARRES